MSCASCSTNVLSAILIVTLFLTTYIGFVIFLCCSVHLVVSYFISFVVCALIKMKINIIRTILWISFSIPFVHLLFGINFKIIFSYFKNIWNVLSFEGIKNTINADFETSKCSKALNVFKYIIIVILILFFGMCMVFETITPDENVIISAFIGTMSVIPLIIGFFKVLLESIKSLFKEPTKSQNNELFSDIQQSLIDDISSEMQSTFNMTEKPEVKQSLLDPCGIMDQVDYFHFLNDPDVNYFYAFFKARHFRAKMIPGFFVLILVLTYIAFDTYNFINLQHYMYFSYIISYVARTFVYCFSIPFLMIFNFTGLLMDSKKTKEKHSFIRTMWIIVSLGYLLLIIVGTAFIIICNLKFTTFIPQNLVYTNKSNPVQASQPASICETKFYGLNMIQYAGIAALGQTSDIKLADEIVKYLFDGSLKPLIVYGNNFTFFYEIEINNALSVIAFNSVIDLKSVSFLLENFCNDFISSKLFGAIIPFYEIAYDLLLSRFLNIISQKLIFYVGVPEIASSYIAANSQIYKEIYNKNITAVYTGHSIGGILAKSVGAYFHVPSVSIESLNYYHSMFDAAMSFYTQHDEFLTNGFQTINLYSPSQLFAQVESNSTMNIELPKWKGSLDYINPYEATCLIAAGCSVDERYDGFCDAVMGINNYRYLFSLWNRTRSDILNK